MNEMRKLMEAVTQAGRELERTSDASTVNVLGKTEFSMSADFAGNTDGGEGNTARTLRIEVLEYKNNKFVDDGIHVNIIEDGYDGFNLSFTLDDFKRFVNTIGKLVK